MPKYRRPKPGSPKHRLLKHRHPLVKAYPPLEESINIGSHISGLLLSIVGLLALVLRAWQQGPGVPLLAVGIFGLSMVALYAVSALYHSATDARIRIRRRVYDHACIYVLIAGTYTPFALISLPPAVGYVVFLWIWGLALAGIILKLFYTGRFDVLSTLMYVAMGWLVVFFFKDFAAALSSQALAWLAAGGVLYTLGAVMYSIKRIPMGHAIFHVCVVLGSLCHYICIYAFVLP